VDALFAARRDEAAADELGIDLEVVGQFLGVRHEFAVDLDAAGVEIEESGEAGDDAEAAAPFAEKSARRNVRFGQRTQDTVDRPEVAWDERGDRVVDAESLDAPIRFLDESSDIAGDWSGVRRQLNIDEGNGQDLSRKDYLAARGLAYNCQAAGGKKY
jgi:hypothetical protein